ncbi:MAG: DUF423 domain-containing protein [Chloroflexi bacterium]|nr:DUF423 domain-containing protein [Chloroflexota bacterium]
MERVWLTAGAALAFVAVGAGAFGAHALRDMLTPERLDVWETAARYQMYHALALIALGILAAGKPDGGPLAWAGWAFLAGVLLFSGSLYLLCLTDVRWLGAVTPLGGVAFLAGWAMFAWGVWQR